MLKLVCLKICAVVALCCWTMAIHAHELNGRWRLRVMDLSHHVKVDAAIRFVGTRADESCMAGSWKRVVVDSNKVRDEAFFPLAQPLAYTFVGSNVTFGLTKICDRYRFMSGKTGRASIYGDYYSPGLGGRENLGYFSLTRLR